LGIASNTGNGNHIAQHKDEQQYYRQIATEKEEDRFQASMVAKTLLSDNICT